MQVYSTDHVSPAQGFSYWREVLTQHFIHLRPELRGDGRFSSTIHAQDLANCSFSRVTASAQRIHRTPREIARSPYDLVFLNLHVAGEGSYLQNGEERPLKAGDLFVIDAVEPFELGCAKNMIQLSLKVPRNLLWEKLRRPHNARGAFISGANHIGKLLGGYLQTLWQHDADPGAEQKAVEHLFDLAAYDLGRRVGDPAIPRAAMRAAIYVRARRYIRATIAEPDLSPASVAFAVGVSLRTLQSIFAERGNAVARDIQKARVEAAALLLADASRRGQRIGDIAMAAGFNELSHFTHAFVRAYGETPGAWRKRHVG